MEDSRGPCPGGSALTLPTCYVPSFEQCLFSPPLDDLQKNNDVIRRVALFGHGQESMIRVGFL